MRSVAIGLCLAGGAGPRPLPGDTKASIIHPSDGQVIPDGRFPGRMGLGGAGIPPMGAGIKYTGHHHPIAGPKLPPRDADHVPPASPLSSRQITIIVPPGS